MVWTPTQPGWLYGWDPSINSPAVGPASIALTRYEASYGQSDSSALYCADDGDVNTHQMKLHRDAEVYLPGQQRSHRYNHPVLNDAPLPTLLLWHYKKWDNKQTYLINWNSTPQSLGEDYMIDPNASSDCVTTATIGQATLGGGSGRSLIRYQDKTVLFASEDDVIELTGFEIHQPLPGCESPCEWIISDLPRIGMINTLDDGSIMAAFIVTATRGSGAGASALYRVTVGIDNQQEVTLIAREGQDIGPEIGRDSVNLLTEIGLTNPSELDGYGSEYLRTIGINSAGQVAFRCTIGVGFAAKDAILLSTGDDLEVIVDTGLPYTSQDHTVCGDKCTARGPTQTRSMLHPLLSDTGEVAFTGGLAHEDHDDEFIGVNRRTSSGDWEETILVREHGLIKFKTCLQEFLNIPVLHLGDLSTNGMFSEYLPMSVSEYGDVALLCRLEPDLDSGGSIDDRNNDLLLIFDRNNEVIAWVREGEVHTEDNTKLIAHMWNGENYDTVEMCDPNTSTTFDCEPGITFPEKWGFNDDHKHCFLSVRATDTSDGIHPYGGSIHKLASPFGFARGSGGSDGRARAFGEYGVAADDEVPGRTFVFTGQVGLKMTLGDGDEQTIHYDKCKSGVFTLRLPGTADLAERCLGDINGDGEVDVDDFSYILFDWGKHGCRPPDLDGDGWVGLDDFSIFLVQFGKICE